jgi:SAM-dependent methyltransferase
MGYEIDYYENPLHWRLDHYLGNPLELAKFSTLTSFLSQKQVSSLLDVGTGNGALLSFLERSDNSQLLADKAVGVDRAVTAIRMSECESPLIQGDIQSLPFPQLAFNCVSALEVLEHIPWRIYEKTLQELERVSSRYIVVSVPYQENRFNVRCPLCQCEFNPSFHMRSFNEHDLRQLFKSFKCVNIISVGQSRSPMLESLLYSAYPLLARLGMASDQPATSLCPQCGYSPSSDPKSTPSDKKSRAGQSSLYAIARKFWPKITRPTWYMAFYNRI